MQPTATDRRGGRLPVVGIEKEPVGQDLDPGGQFADPIRHRAGQVGVAVSAKRSSVTSRVEYWAISGLRRPFRDDLSRDP